MRDQFNRLPSLDHLKGFVAVGRRLSITRAAEELCLTQSAVSRQILALEDALGIHLFSRGHRSIAFTPDGEKLYRVVVPLFETLSESINSIALRVGRSQVTITASVGVVAVWLLPRLGKFQAQHPEIDVRVAANNKILDLQSEGIDLAIRYCPRHKAPKTSRHLFGETLAPIAHTSLSDVVLTSAAGLSKLTLLEYEDANYPFLRWDDWLAAYELDSSQARAVLRFNQYDQVIQTAAAGQGIALGRFPLVESIMLDRQLRKLNSGNQLLSPDRQYWVIPATPTLSAGASAVMKWIEEEASQVVLSTEACGTQLVTKLEANDQTSRLMTAL